MGADRSVETGTGRTSRSGGAAERRRRRPARWWGMVLATTVAASVLTGQAASTAAPANGAATGCAQHGSTRPVAGRSALTASHPLALVRNVQVQASGCADVLEFLFWGGRPGWSVAYKSGPLHLDPSGRVVRLRGAAHLVVRLSPASGTDPATGAAIYGGPTAMTPARPSGFAAVRRLGDFEAVTTWAVGLPDRRPFTVRTAANRLIVTVTAPSPRPRRCLARRASLSIGYLRGWFAELTPMWACAYFGPRPFPIVPNSDARTWTVTVATTTVPAAKVVAATIASGGVRRRTTHVAGYGATVLDVTVPKNAPFLPAGYRYRLYVIAAKPRTVMMQSVPVPPGPAVQRLQRALDQMAALTRRP